MCIEYEEDMEKRGDIIITGRCQAHGIVQAMPKRYIGSGLEPLWLCSQCRELLKGVKIEKIKMPCAICGFFDANDVGLGNYVCFRCYKTWQRVDEIVKMVRVVTKEDANSETSDDQ